MKKQSGIDISLNDKASEIAFEYAKKSFKNVKNIKSTTKDGDFSGGFEILLNSSYGLVPVPALDEFNNISIASDGIGTKVELAERLNKYDSLGYDLMAMVCDDLISNFYIPKFISNILDIDYINLNIINELMKGLSKAAKEAEVIISGGEIAELGDRINGYGKNMHFNWAATAIGFLSPFLMDRTGNVSVLALSHSIKKGDKVYAFKSNGFRSNGFSLARKVLQEAYGDDWHDFKFNQDNTWGSILLRPSKLYTPLVKKILENNTESSSAQVINIKKIAHITGGGFLNNTNRILPENLRIKITNAIETPDYFLKLMELGKISKKQAEITWNMGYGMVLITSDEINTSVIDWPIQLIGEIVENEDNTNK